MNKLIALIIIFCAVSFGSKAQHLSIEELIKGIKNQKAKDIYRYALKKGMSGSGLEAGKTFDFASDDYDKELLAGSYTASLFDDKENFNVLITIDSFAASHKVQLSYSIPDNEAAIIKQYLVKNNYQHRVDGDTEFWEKDGIIVDIHKITSSEIYIYLKE